MLDAFSMEWLWAEISINNRTKLSMCPDWTALTIPYSWSPSVTQVRIYLHWYKCACIKMTLSLIKNVRYTNTNYFCSSITCLLQGLHQSIGQKSHSWITKVYSKWLCLSGGSWDQISVSEEETEVADLCSDWTFGPFKVFVQSKSWMSGSPQILAPKNRRPPKNPHKFQLLIFFKSCYSYLLTASSS